MVDTETDESLLIFLNANPLLIRMRLVWEQKIRKEILKALKKRD